MVIFLYINVWVTYVREKAQRYFGDICQRSPMSSKKHSDISRSETQGHPCLEIEQRYFISRWRRSPMSEKKHSDISHSETQGHLCLEIAQRYFPFRDTRSPMSGNSIAIFRSQMPEVTYVWKQHSDISGPDVRGHSCLEIAQRYFPFRDTRSPMSGKKNRPPDTWTITTRQVVKRTVALTPMTSVIKHICY